ncbi:tyrosine-type recombinase/integrase [Phenylobacterium sp.]|uniref:tyrosine-type recombinase/integrase n=1 Tax=Phenylobacterium sp. TaxID=1871053 RepID=UPI0035665772
MSDKRQKLTRKIVEAVEPGPKDQFLWDSEVVGFGVRVRPGGHRGYILQYRFAGRARQYQIGAHGSPWTVETARDRARVLQGQVAGGEDPQDSKLGSRKEVTVAQLCDQYLAEGLATRKQTSIDSARSDIDNHIKPLLGAKRASLVTRQDVDQLLADVAAGKTRRTAKTAKKRGLSIVRGGKGAANSAVVTLSAAMGFAVARGVRPDNPAFRVRRFPEKKLERFLSPAEIARLGEALAAAEAVGVESPSAIAAIRLLVLTGCRKNEVLTLKPGFVDRHHRCFRLPDSKTGHKIVHIGAPALKVIDGICPEGSNIEYVLPGEWGTGHFVNLQRPWERIRAAAGLDDVRIHDLRHAFASLGAATGDSLLVIGALLGHRSAKTTHRYAHLAEHPVKDAAARISAEMSRLLGDELVAFEPGPSAPSLAADAGESARAQSLLGRVSQTRWLPTEAAAAYVGLSVPTLHTYRWAGTGPVSRKIGKRVVYAQADLDAWMAGRALDAGWMAAE